MQNTYTVEIFWVYLFSQSGGHASLRSEGQKERRPTRLRLAGWKKDRTLEQDQTFLTLEHDQFSQRYSSTKGWKKDRILEQDQTFLNIGT